MNKVNNKHGIEFYYDIEDTRVVIYDSQKTFMNDLYFNDFDDDEIESIKEDLETTTLEDMCSFMNFKIYDSMEEICTTYDMTEDEILTSGYLNIFNVNDKRKYVFYED